MKYGGLECGKLETNVVFEQGNDTLPKWAAKAGGFVSAPKVWATDEHDM